MKRVYKCIVGNCKNKHAAAKLLALNLFDIVQDKFADISDQQTAVGTGLQYFSR